MARLTKSKLKSIVKECLVEILAEGLATNTASLKNRGESIRQQQIKQRKLEEHRKRFETTVDTTVANVTDDPIMQGILQDTARTTLQEQIANETPSARAGASSAPGLDAGTAGAGINLDSIFSGPSRNWDKLAFND